MRQSAEFNPYRGLPYAELCGIRKDYAKMLHAAVAARKCAERNLGLIGQAIEVADDERAFEASDHAVVRYLERVRGMDVSALREEIAANCEHGAPIIGDKMRGMDGFLYCLNDDGYITTVLPLDAVVDEAKEQERALSARPMSGQRRRRLRAKRAFIASAGEAFGRDGETRLDAEHEHAVPEGQTPNSCKNCNSSPHQRDS